MQSNIGLRKSYDVVSFLKKKCKSDPKFSLELVTLGISNIFIRMLKSLDGDDESNQVNKLSNI